jgi:hypothetical protein
VVEIFTVIVVAWVPVVVRGLMEHVPAELGKPVQNQVSVPQLSVTQVG